MKKWVGAVLLMVGLLSIPAQGRAENSRYISVTGNAEIRVVPNEIGVQVGVETRDPLLANAIRLNEERVKNVLAVLAEYRIDSRSMQTDYLSVEPRYEERGGKPADYAVTKQIQITVKEVAKFDDFIKSVIEAGANYVNGIELGVGDVAKYSSQVQASAVSAAKRKAEHLAKAAGLKIGKLRMIREDNVSDWTTSNTIHYGGLMGGRGATFALGQIIVQAKVTVEFELLDHTEKI